MGNKKLQHYLACLGEECGEVQQLIGKALRFGFEDQNPVTLEDNKDAILREFNDLCAAMELVYKTPAHYLMDKDAIERKKVKVEHWRLKYEKS